MNEQNLYSTQVLHEHILYCDNQEDFRREILNSLKGQRALWKEKISSIMEEKGYNLTTLAAMCGVSRVAVKKWCDGSLPQSRDLFIRIGFAAGYNLGQMNQFLQRFGRYPALYPKSLEDSVIIFVLNSEKFPHTYTTREMIRQQIESEVRQAKCELNGAKTDDATDSVFDISDSADDVCSTVHMLSGIMSVETASEMADFVQKNSEAYLHAYENFYSYIRLFIEKNNIDPVTGKPCSIHALAELQGWSSSLRKCVAAIYKGDYFPGRRKVISMGLHLNMNLNQINVALSLAGMEELYAKNPLESGIIYALCDADLNDMIVCDGSVELFEYVCEVLRDLEIPEAEEFLNSV